MRSANLKRISRRRIPTHAGWLLLWFLLGELPAIGANENRKDMKLEDYALLAGTCFGEKGLSLPGVTVEAVIQASGGAKPKRKKWTASTDMRGEFALRLPAGKATFLIRASKNGYQSQEKIVIFSNDEREDILFNMKSLPPKK